jgi:hypothetical protein
VLCQISAAATEDTNRTMKALTRVLALLIAAVSFTAVPSCEAQTEKETLYDKSYAVVIGISRYQNPERWKNLANAENDATAMAEFLQSTGFKVTALYNEKATKDAIAKAFISLSKEVGEEDRVLIFFAGHGATETYGRTDRGFIVPYAATGEVETYIDMDDLKKYSKYMEKAKHQLFIMDSCYGGTLSQEDTSRGVKTGFGSAPHPPGYIHEITKKWAREVLTAGGKDQEVLDGGGLFEGHSFFTGRLLEALKYGRADKDNDGYITFAELVDYMKDKARNDKQTPHWDAIEGHMGGKDFVFISPVSAHLKIMVAQNFEAEDPSKGAIPVLKGLGPMGLMEEFAYLQEAEHVWGVEFRPADGAQDLPTRGDQRLSRSSDMGQQGDYLLKVMYLRLDRSRVRLEAQFKRNNQNVPEIPMQIAETSVDSPDYRVLAKEILRQFASDPDHHLHLVIAPSQNCSDAMNNQAQSAIDAWLTQMNLPRLKFTKEQDKNSGADVNLSVLMVNTSESNRQIFTVYMRVTHEDKSKTFSRSSDAGPWAVTLKAAQADVEAYLVDVLREF